MLKKLVSGVLKKKKKKKAGIVATLDADTRVLVILAAADSGSFPIFVYSVNGDAAAVHIRCVVSVVDTGPNSHTGAVLDIPNDEVNVHTGRLRAVEAVATGLGNKAAVHFGKASGVEVKGI